MPSPPPAPPAAANQPDPTSPPATESSRIPVPMVLGAVVLIGVIAAGAWFLHGRSAPASTVPPTTTTPTPIAVSPPSAVARGAAISIPNFSFETPVVENYLYNCRNASWTFSTNGAASGSGVTSINKGDDSFTGKNLPAPEGSQVAFLQATGSISQTLTGFVPGAKYKLSFAAAQRANKHGGQKGETFNVLLGALPIGSFGPDQTTTTYYEYSVIFVAPAANNTLTFLGTDLNGGDNTVLIDDVQITPL